MQSILLSLVYMLLCRDVWAQSAVPEPLSLPDLVVTDEEGDVAEVMELPDLPLGGEVVVEPVMPEAVTGVQAEAVMAQEEAADVAVSSGAEREDEEMPLPPGLPEDEDGAAAIMADPVEEDVSEAADMPVESPVQAAAQAVEKAVAAPDPNDPFNEKLVAGITFFDPEELAERMKFAVEEDHAPSQYIIGRMYAEGVAGLKIDYNLASQWLGQAARKGYAPAMIELGKLYKFGGENLVADGEVALEWFEKAAEKDEPQAFIELGLMYENGVGVYQNLKKAFEYYTKAKERGLLEAYTKLGLMHQYGRGAEFNLPLAIRYFNKVKLESDDPYVRDAHRRLLGELYAEISISQTNSKLAFEWMRRAAEEGHPNSFLAMADAYRDGRGVPQDYTRAVAMYLKMAKEEQNIYAMQVLGYMYGNGLGVVKDYEKAHEWYLEAANLGDAEAAYQLGNLYFYGHGVKQDKQEAQKWFGRSQVLASRARAQKK